MTGAPIDLSLFRRAVATLKVALSSPPANDLERDGVIQRFEYTFELSWKAAKRLLAEAGIQSSSPKSVIRDVARQEWIDDAEKWMAFLRARNATSHTYREAIAQEVYDAAQRFLPEAEKLLARLEVELQ